jgi:hypothetical protein
VSNYLVGNDPSQWHTAVAHYGRVAYQNVAPGLDVSYYGNGGQLEYDLVLHPGVHPASVRLRFDGQQGLSLDAAGDLLVQLAQGQLVEHAPVLFQDGRGVRHAVSGRYVLGGRSRRPGRGRLRPRRDTHRRPGARLLSLPRRQWLGRGLRHRRGQRRQHVPHRLQRAGASGRRGSRVAGWVAVDVAVGSDNKTRILWDNTLTGQMIVWTVDDGFAISAGPTYGGYPGWTARALTAGRHLAAAVGGRQRGRERVVARPQRRLPGLRPVRAVLNWKTA